MKTGKTEAERLDDLAIEREAILTGADNPFDFPHLYNAASVHPESEPVRRWELDEDDERRADWMLARVATLQARLSRIDEQAAREKALVERMREKRRRVDENELRRRIADLESYAVARRASDGAKTIDLAFGSLKTRKAKARLVIDHDDDDLLAAVKEITEEDAESPLHGAIIERVARGTLRNLLKIDEEDVVVKATGEVLYLDWLHVEDPGTVSFSFKVREGGA